VARVAELPSNDRCCPAGVSVGVATFDPAKPVNADVGALVQAADRALYRAKASGRNRVEAA
jgi:PleD family two-component response regulator